MLKFYKPPKSIRIIKTGFIILFLTGFFAIVQAQNLTVTGVVTAGDTKETLPGATVVVKGTTTGVVTNIDGKYSISVKSGKTILVFSFMGYFSSDFNHGYGV